MAGGFRSPLFLLGASAGAAAPVQGGVKMLARWMGGASAPEAPATQAGFRSLQAFWIGGATSGTAIPSGPQPGGGDSREEWLRLRGQIIREDSEFIEILAALIENEIIH